MKYIFNCMLLTGNLWTFFARYDAHEFGWAALAGTLVVIFAREVWNDK